MAEPTANPPPSPLTARDRRPFVVLQAANAVSLSGNQVAALAIPWFVLQSTGSATLTGIVGAAGFLPIVLSALFGGAIVDRLGFRRVSILADLASGLTVALIPLLHAAEALGFPTLVALVFLGALLDTPGATARAALVPDLAARGGIAIERATASEQAVERGSLLVGAPLAGALIAVLGPTAVLWLNAASFAVSALLVAVALPGSAIPAPEPRERSRGYRAELAEGLRFIRDDTLMRALLAVLVVTNFLDAVWGSVLAPVFALEVYGSPLALGLMAAAGGGGAVAGALAYAAVGPRWPRLPPFLAGFAVAGSRTIFLATLPGLPVAVAIVAVGGFGAGPLNPILGAVWYERIPAYLRGRVLGAGTAVSYAAIPLGALAGGPLLGAVGLRGALLAVGGVYLATILAALAIPAIRDLDAKRGTEPDGAASG